MESLHATLNSTQSEQTASFQKQLDEAERSNQLLRQNVETLSAELKVQKENTALAERDFNEVQQVMRKEHEERIAALVEEHKHAMGERERGCF